MTITLTDLFCGAGGSSHGAEQVRNVQVVMAANHWDTAIEVHQSHFPEARHDLADVSQADPRRYPATNILLASPECVNHSQARGVSRKKQQADLFGEFDPAAERSRATMWDVGRFAEQIHYDAIIVENVVEATRWSGWEHWLGWLTTLGYQHKVISANSMHFGVPQSRDRIYVVFWRKGLKPDLEMEVTAWCTRCDRWGPARQAWKPQRTVGRYRQQWTWACTGCGREVRTTTEPAASIIDWQLPCPRIGGRARPLAQATRDRILAGLQRYGWAPITTAGAGNTWERTPGMRARPLTEPLPAQHATGVTAMATPPGFLVQTAHKDKPDGPVRFRGAHLSEPHPTVCGDDDRHSLVVPLRTHGVPHDSSEPLQTVTAGNGGGGHGLIITQREGGSRRAHLVAEPLPTVTSGGQNHALLVRSNGFVGSGPLGRFTSSTDDPAPTMVTTQRPALLMRNNRGGAEMVTPVTEEIRTVTAKCQQSLLVPYDRTSPAYPVTEPAHTFTSRDRCALVDTAQAVDDCGFRMLEPHEIAAAMAFPEGYIPGSYTKKDQIRLAGNAVTPPVMAWLVGRVARALEEAG